MAARRGDFSWAQLAMRLRVWLVGLALAAVAAAAQLASTWSSGVAAQEITYYRIGAGAPGSSSFDLAGLVGGAISAPPGSRQCDVEGPCGVTGLQATAHAADSAVASLTALGSGELESAVASADLVIQAAEHRGPFAKQPELPTFAAIANVGWSYLHILVKADSTFAKGSDLRGKRVALGAKNSDNALTAQFLLKAAGLSTKAVTAMEGDIDAMAQAVDGGKASALIIVDGIVSPDVDQLLKTGKYRLLPMDFGQEPDEAAAKIVEPRKILAGAYGQGADVETLAVPFTWVVRGDADPQLITSLAQALRRTADHPQPAVTGAARASIELDVRRLPVPLHPGAGPILKGFVQPTVPSVPQGETTN